VNNATCGSPEKWIPRRGTRTELRHQIRDGGFHGYARAGIIGQVSTCSPDNANVNPKPAFDSAAEAQAVNLPRLSPRFIVGITHSRGR
jgi:hypothetical protein